MRIYTRAEWGALPPKSKLPSGLTKKGFLIHHTASGNGVLTLEQEKAQQRAWQIQHMGAYTDHKGQDILHGASVFKSGRVFEGRMPWDSNNGAAYNAGYEWFGIECDGNFYGSHYMGNVQYQALVEFCAYIHKLKGFPLVFKGHREIPGNDTACPGNLMHQFINNGKLKNDVARVVMEETDMGHALCRETGRRSKVEEGHAWMGKLGNRTENLYLHFTGITGEPAKVKITVYTDEKIESTSKYVPLNKHVEVNLASIGPQGSVTWRFESDRIVLWSPDWRADW